MTTRLSSTLASANSAAWSPVDETILQLDFASTSRAPQVAIQAKVDAAAPYRTIEVLTKNKPFVRIAQFPFLQLIMSDNEATKQVTVYDNE